MELLGTKFTDIVRFPLLIDLPFGDVGVHVFLHLVLPQHDEAAELTGPGPHARALGDLVKLLHSAVQTEA